MPKYAQKKSESHELPVDKTHVLTIKLKDFIPGVRSPLSQSKCNTLSKLVFSLQNIVHDIFQRNCLTL